MESNNQLMTVQDMKACAIDFAKSKLFAMEQPEQIFALMMVCQSEGIHPVQALKRYHIIEGRPSMRADAMQAEYQRQGGTLQWVESSDDACEAIFTHSSSPTPFRLRVTLKQYTESGVAMTFDRTSGKQVLKKNWKQFPAAMLRARVISAGVRAVLPGVVAGIYTPEEVQDFEKTPTPPPSAPQPTQKAPAASAKKAPTKVEEAQYTEVSELRAPTDESSTEFLGLTPATERAEASLEQPSSREIEQPTAKSLPEGIPATAPTTFKDLVALSRLLKNHMPADEHDALRADLNACANDAARVKVMQKAIDGLKVGF